MTTKLTKKDMFTAIKSMMTNEAPENVTPEMVIEFCDKQIELLAKRTTGERKPTKTQLENEGFKGNIIEALTIMDKPLTIKELAAACPAIAELSNQRITHMLTALRKEGKVRRDMVKRVAHYSIGSELEDVETTQPDEAEEG